LVIRWFVVRLHFSEDVRGGEARRAQVA
jgi:hypothetical protein